MTDKERDRIENAIRHIQTAVDVDPWAVEIAVEAMQEKISREQSEDVISRQAAIDAVKRNTFRLTFAEEQNCEGHVAWSADAVYSDVIEGALLELPSAEPERKTVNLRVEKISKHQSDFSDLDAEPKRKTGRWMRYGEDGGHNDQDTVYWQCDQCLNTERGRRGTPAKFCPNCGARMQP